MKRLKSYFKRISSIFNIKKELVIVTLIIALFIFIDYLDICAGFINSHEILLNYFCIISLLGYSILFICFASKESINQYDCINLNLIIINIILLSLSFISPYISLGFANYIKWYYLLISLIIFLVFLIYRIFHIKNFSILDNKVYELKDLIDGTIFKDLRKSNNNHFIISSKPAIKDVLDRNIIVNSLYNHISYKTTGSSSVYSLLGKWGSGKTTIIQMLKKKCNDDFIFCDSFDPFKYSTSEKMFNGLLIELAKCLNIKTINIKRAINKISSDYVSGNKTKAFLDLFSDISNYDLIDLIKDRLNNSNKKLIFVIDNIDRLSDKQIILVFKVVGSILNLNNIVFILCYDKEYLGRSFDKCGYDKNYDEKFILKNFFIESKDELILNKIFYSCANQLLNIYGLESCKEFEILLRSKISLFTTPRQLILIINSLEFELFKIGINFFDYLILQIIKYYDFSCYEGLREIKKFILSFDNPDPFNVLSKDEFEKNKKVELNKFLDGKDSVLIELLSFIFPEIASFKEKQLPTLSYEEAIKNKRICSGLFFESYFADNLTDYNRVNNEVLEFIKKIDKGADIGIIGHELLYVKENNQIPYIFKSLEANIDDWNKYIDLMIYLFYQYRNFRENLFDNNYCAFIYLFIRNCQSLSIDNLNKFLTKTYDYHNLFALSLVESRLTQENLILKDKSFLSNLQLNVNKLKKEIISNKINLFQKSNYFCGSMGLLGNERGYISYVKTVLNKNTVFGILCEYIYQSNGTDNAYIFFAINRIDKIKSLIGNIRTILKDIDNLNTFEEKIRSLFKNTDFSITNFDSMSDDNVKENVFLELKYIVGRFE